MLRTKNTDEKETERTCQMQLFWTKRTVHFLSNRIQRVADLAKAGGKSYDYDS